MTKPITKSERIADLTAKVRELEAEREAMKHLLDGQVEFAMAMSERWGDLWSFVSSESLQHGPARELRCRILARMSELAGDDWCDETQGEQDCD